MTFPKAGELPKLLSFAGVRRGDDFWKAFPSMRERCNAWAKGQNGKGIPCSGFPQALVAFYMLKMFVYVWIYLRFVRDPELPLMSAKNYKLLHAYTMLGDAMGSNTNGGPLGFRSLVGSVFLPMYNMLTPGTITGPLWKGASGIRSPPLVLGYAVYIALMFRLVMSPEEIGFYDAAPPLAVLFLMAPFDWIPAELSRFEHYGCLLVCMCFSGQQWLFGCQCVQIALWAGAGTAKIGLWFPHVMSQMIPNCQFARFMPQMIKMLYKDFPKDMNPSQAATVLSHFGTATEIGMGLLCAFPPTRYLGVGISCSFHFWIMLQLPFASVQEWNIFCTWTSVFLFGFNEFQIPENLNPILSILLVVFLLIVPIYGQLYPREVHFLHAFRPYAGNWFTAWFIASKAGQEKMRKLKTAESLFYEETDPASTIASKLPEGSMWLQDKEMYSQFPQYGMLAELCHYPQYRNTVPVLEKLEQLNGWKSGDDYRTFWSMPFLALVHGYNLASGWHCRKNAPLFPSLQQVCQFEKGEFNILVQEPMSPLDHICRWFVVDVADPSTYGGQGLHGEAPFQELEKFQHFEMELKDLEKYIQGTTGGAESKKDD